MTDDKTGTHGSSNATKTVTPAQSPTSEVSVSDCISPIVQDAFDGSLGTCSPLHLSVMMKMSMETGILVEYNSSRKIFKMPASVAEFENNEKTNVKACKCCRRWYKAAKELRKLAKERNDTELKIVSNNLMDQIDACPQK
ncbi:hypothetical protein JTE90_024397 [Oedothorax gibbosus]|uniref:Uncharacterized protein n=1 Tax=Oedothorax gibbosus TaxID=931172 RepID=A0AAV6TS02_9ARAC|nr:hypothetical protein JTE90_024397 [Oedothorax gibbosus]